MKIKPVRFILKLLLILILGWLWRTPALAAANYRLTPSEITISVNGEFTVDVNIDAETNQVMGGAAFFLYNPSEIEIIAVTNGTYFPTLTQANDHANGQLELNAYTTNPLDPKTGSGLYAQIRARATAEFTASQILFICNSDGAFTNLLNVDGTNILACSALSSLTLRMITPPTNTTSPTPTPTPSPTPPPGVTYTPTPTPNEENKIPTCAAITVSPINNIYVNSEVIFTCTGVDPDGDITEVEFDFGDGIITKVTQNVGSPGTLRTTHHYPRVGTYGASCRVRDNNNVYSSVPNFCKRSVSVIKKSTTTNLVTAGGSVRKLTPTPTKRPSVTPTIQEVTLKPFASPTPIGIIVPSETPGAGSQFPFGQLTLFFIFAVCMIVGIKLIIKKPNDDLKPKPPVIIEDFPPGSS